MSFAPLEEIEGPIELTLRGQTYTLPVLTMEEGVHLQARLLEGMTMPELAAALLGPDLLERLNGLPAPVIERVGFVAIAEWRFGREAAQKVWRDPKALIPMMEALRKAVEAASTPQPDSMTSTTSQAAKTKGSRSRGKKS
jgi:hypothetical protein